MFPKAEGSHSRAQQNPIARLSRIFIASEDYHLSRRPSPVPSTRKLSVETLSADRRSSSSKAGCKRQFSLTGVKRGYLMGARHHSTNERNGKWTMRRRAYSDENRHCAMWLTCKGMPAQHETGISIQMLPRTWSRTPRIYANMKREGKERFLERLSNNGARKTIFPPKSYIYILILFSYAIIIRELVKYKIVDKN